MQKRNKATILNKLLNPLIISAVKRSCVLYCLDRLDAAQRLKMHKAHIVDADAGFAATLGPANMMKRTG
jgi:hypothetical protein